jgi:predicted nucleic acid-binding protein
MRFWDASALIPLCLQERLSSRLKRLAQQDESLVVWWGSPVECLSAFARLRREAVLGESDEEQARHILRVLQGAWTEVEPTHAVREQAGRVLRLHPLRAADALQLAAALVWSQGDPVGHDFVCLDQRLKEAAQREGFTILPKV